MVKQVEVRAHVGRAGIFEKNESLLWRAWPANSLAFGCCVYAHAFCDRPMNAMKAMKTVKPMKTLQEMMSSTSIGLPTRSHLSQRSFGVGGWWTGAETGHVHGRSGGQCSKVLELFGLKLSLLCFLCFSLFFLFWAPTGPRYRCENIPRKMSFFTKPLQPLEESRSGKLWRRGEVKWIREVNSGSLA